MIEINMDGLERIGRNAERLNGTHRVQLGEIFTETFMRQHSRFTSIDEMFGASSFKVDSVEAFEAIPTADLDAFVSANTDFSGWDEMLAEAAEEKIAHDLFS